MSEKHPHTHRWSEPRWCEGGNGWELVTSCQSQVWCDEHYQHDCHEIRLLASFGGENPTLVKGEA